MRVARRVRAISRNQPSVVNEVCDSLRSADLKGYIATKDTSGVYALTRRLYPALNNFIAYLKRNPTGRSRCRSLVTLDNDPVAFRRHLLDLLSYEPRSISSLARELGLKRGDVEQDLQHALRSARTAGHQIEIIPARCKACDFVFSVEKLTKPGRCPSCKGTRLFEPMIRVARTE